MFFLLYKIFLNMLMPPSIIILMFLALGIHIHRKIFMKKIRLITIIYLTFCLIFYIISIDITKDVLAKNIEKNYKVIMEEEICENATIVMLGGGIREGQNGSFGLQGTSSYSASVRLLETARIYFKAKKNGKKAKILISGGKVFNHYLSEAEVYKEYLLGLGIEEENIQIEKESKNTYENAINIKKMDFYDGKKIILVSSASHMKRSEFIFEKVGIEVIPAPCDYIYDPSSYDVFSFIPKGENIVSIKKILWEYIGIVYYKLRF